MSASDDEPRYRVGRSVGRTIYDGDKLIGLMDTPEQAAEAVEAMNARYRVLWDRCNPETGHHSTPHRGCVLR